MQKLADLFGLNDDIWIKHSNKFSVWSRFIILPLLAFSIWSRVWIGWYCWFLIVALIFWTWINPRVFNKPRTTKHWASKAVLGERVWLKNSELSIPTHHIHAVRVLNALTTSGIPFIAWGLYHYELWPTVFGTVLVIVGKLWFLDRMVWIYEDMKEFSKEYQSWEY